MTEQCAGQANVMLVGSYIYVANIQRILKKILKPVELNFLIGVVEIILYIHLDSRNRLEVLR